MGSLFPTDSENAYLAPRQAVSILCHGTRSLRCRNFSRPSTGKESSHCCTTGPDHDCALITVVARDRSAVPCLAGIPHGHESIIRSRYHLCWKLTNACRAEAGSASRIVPLTPTTRFGQDRCDGAAGRDCARHICRSRRGTVPSFGTPS